MRNVLIAAVAAVTLVSQVSGQSQTPAAPKVQLTFEGAGVVSLTATDATVRDILAEWTRKGGTPFVGAERLPAAPVTLQFDHRPEAEVIASLLRNASGYVIGPRPAGSTGASGIEVVYILATSIATAGGYAAPPPAYTPTQASTQGSPASEIPPAGPGGQPQTPQQTDTPSPAPARPAGVSGVAVPVVVLPVTTPPPTGPGRGGGGGGGR